MLADAMSRDDRLVATLDTRVNGLLGLPFELQSADEDSPEAIGLAEAIEPRWWDMFPESELAEARRWRILMGFAIGELVWTRSSSAWWPRLRVWHPQWSWYDCNSERLWLTTQEGQVEVVPGDGKWIVFGQGRRPYMHGAVRSLAVPWLLRQYALRDWGRYSERHGMPMVKAMVPSMVTEAEKSSFFSDIRALATETTAVLPQNVDNEGTGYDLELLEAKDGAWESFERLITAANVSFAINMLGQNLTTEVQGGSYAAATVHDRIRHDYLNADGEELSTQLRAQGLSHVVELNYGLDTLDAPWPRWSTELPDDTKLAAESLKLAGEALSAIQAAGYEIEDPEEFGQRFGVRVRRTADVPEAGAPQQAPNAPESPGASDMADVPGQSSRRVKRSVRLASGDNPADASGFVEGQLYVDDLIDDGVERTRRAMAPDLRELLRIVDTSTDYSDLRVRLREAYSAMPSERFAELMERAFVLSDFAGRYAVAQDL